MLQELETESRRVTGPSGRGPERRTRTVRVPPVGPTTPSAGWRRLDRWLLCFSRRATLATVVARALLLVALALWTVMMVNAPLSRGGSTFLHYINLPIHETGHFVFMPFGRFLHFLGGTLFQILMPLILMGAFLIQKRDATAGSVMLWWAGQNCLDIAPYIADARSRLLPLVGGGQHDWAYLLREMKILHLDHALAGWSFNFGSCVMFAALIWGATVLWMQWDWIILHKNRERQARETRQGEYVQRL